MSFRSWRIFALLLVLVLVAASAFLSPRRLKSWSRPLIVDVEPIAAEPGTETFAAAFDDEALAEVRAFFAREARGTRAELIFNVEPASKHVPPMRPGEAAETIDVALFSLRLRMWSWWHAWRAHLAPADVRIYVLFHRPEPGRLLEHSGSIENAHIAIVYAFADARSRGETAIGIAHELLHTLGASHTDGVMVEAMRSESIADYVVGTETRREIGW